MDKYIIERRARMRMAWFKRFEQIGNVSQVCREFGISRKTFYKWWPHYAREGLPGVGVERLQGVTPSGIGRPLCLSA